MLGGRYDAERRETGTTRGFEAGWVDERGRPFRFFLECRFLKVVVVVAGVTIEQQNESLGWLLEWYFLSLVF